MTNEFNSLAFVKELLQFSPRQGRNEIKTKEFLIDYLENKQISYEIQGFETTIPTDIQAKLFVDNKKVACEGTTFIGGQITSKDYVISSLTSSQNFLDLPNINFNPECKNISQSNFYFAPAIAINRSDIKRVVMAKKILATIKVKKIDYASANILVGNQKSPKNIFIAHYDSIKTGATDNASGVSVLMNMIISHPKLIQNNLFVFSGNEELSYDQPIYWGRGFRKFEEHYFGIMTKTKKIFVVDCVGNGPTSINQDRTIMTLGFPIKRLNGLFDKVFNVSGDIQKLMTVYHSDGDTLNQLKEKYLQECSNMLVDASLDATYKLQVGSGI